MICAVTQEGPFDLAMTRQTRTTRWPGGRLNRLIAGLLLLAAMLGVVPAEATPHREATTCLQRQLNALGHDAGADDGVMGPKTRRALAAYERAAGAPLSTRRLTAASAIVFCRALGRTIKQMRVYWPSEQQPFEVVLARDVPEAERVAVDAAIRRAQRVYFDQHDLTVPQTIRVIVGSKRQDLVQLLRQHALPHVTSRSFDAAFNRFCGLPDQPGGFAYDGAIVICLGTGRPALGKPQVQPLVLHEVFHEIQNQLSGFLDVTSADPAFLNRRGPAWLIEGSAEAAATLALTPGYTHALLPRAFRLSLAEGDRDLADLERWITDPAVFPRLYSHGAYAAMLLGRSGGIPALAGFYQRLGSGQSWRDAFKESFGRDAAEFYVQFQQDALAGL